MAYCSHGIVILFWLQPVRGYGFSQIALYGMWIGLVYNLFIWIYLRSVIELTESVKDLYYF